MNLEELLESLGIDKEVCSKIIKAMKDNKIYTTNEENLDIRYNQLKERQTEKDNELANANNLISELKKKYQGQDDLQQKISEYEQKVAEYEQKIKQQKIDHDIEIALLGEKATDLDYLIYRLKNDKEIEVKVDENGEIKGLDNIIKGLKEKHPNHFEIDSNEKIFKINELPEGEEVKKEPQSLAEALKMTFENKE